MAAPEETPLHITLTFRHRNGSSEEDIPRAFWSQVQQNRRNSGLDEASPRRLEERIVSSFGRDLRDTLINEFMFGRSARNRYKRRFPEELLEAYRPVPSGTIPMFAFQVTGLNYGSLSLGLDIAGAKGLVEFFNNNYGLFQTVLTQYAPLAFAVAATGFDSAHIDGLTCTVNAPQQVVDAFNQPTATPGVALNTTQQPGGRAPTNLQALNRMWIAANTSLIPAVVLALAVLFIAFQSLSNEKAEVTKAMSQLQERQNEVIRLLAPQPVQPKAAAPSPAPASGTGAPVK